MLPAARENSSTSHSQEIENLKPSPALPAGRQAGPQCGYPIGVIAGSKEAICKNCGFKDPCCE